MVDVTTVNEQSKEPSAVTASMATAASPAGPVKKAAPKKPAEARPGYKFVKVRKDGKIIRVERPIDADGHFLPPGAQPTAASAPAAQTATTTDASQPAAANPSGTVLETKITSSTSPPAEARSSTTDAPKAATFTNTSPGTNATTAAKLSVSAASKPHPNPTPKTSTTPGSKPAVPPTSTSTATANPAAKDTITTTTQKNATPHNKVANAASSPQPGTSRDTTAPGSRAIPPPPPAYSETAPLAIDVAAPTAPAVGVAAASDIAGAAADTAGASDVATSPVGGETAASGPSRIGLLMRIGLQTARVANAVVPGFNIGDEVHGGDGDGGGWDVDYSDDEEDDDYSDEEEEKMVDGDGDGQYGEYQDGDVEVDGDDGTGEEGDMERNADAGQDSEGGGPTIGGTVAAGGASPGQGQSHGIGSGGGSGGGDARGIGTFAAQEFATGLSKGALAAQGQQNRSVVGNGQTVQMETKKAPAKAPGTVKAPVTVAAKGKTAPAADPSIEKKTPTVNVTDAGAPSSKVPGAKPPRLLRPRTATDPSRIIVWSTMILLPLLFIILGVLVAVVDGRLEDDSFAKGVNQALKVGISAWPIIFAAVTAQCLRAVATWKVERGVRMMTLEQLISSNSVASSFKQPFVLRRFDWVTVALFALWSLSPLAGQAMVRVQYIESGVTLSNVTIPYIDTGSYSWTFGIADSLNFTTDDRISDMTDTTAVPKKLYVAGFLPNKPDSFSVMDPYNNPLIPLIEEETGPRDAEGWVTLTSGGVDDGPLGAHTGRNYTSFYGLPLVRLQGGSDTSFTVNVTTAYLRLNCSAPAEMTMAQVNATLGPDDDPFNEDEGGTLWVSIDKMQPNKDGKFRMASMIRPATVMNGSVNTGTTGTSVTTYAHSACTFHQVSVEVSLVCTANQNETNYCGAAAMRELGTGIYTLTADSPGVIRLLFLSSQMGNFGNTDTERYILDPDTVNHAYKVNGDAGFNLTTVPHDLFQQRVSKLFNTFWWGGMTGEYITQPLSGSDTFVPAPGTMLGAPLVTLSGNPVKSSVARRMDYPNIYGTSWAWLSVLFASSSILLFAGVAAVYFDHDTIVPDILGFASSVARKSKYVDLPKMDMTMSGAERANKLKELTVMMMDVKPDAPVGRVALGTWHKEAKKLEAGRPYR